MKTTKPLGIFPVTATSRVEEAEHRLSRILTDLEINRVDDRSNFRLELNAVNFKRVSLIYNCFGTHTKLTTGLDSDEAIFVTGIGKPISLHMDNELHLVTHN